ncbi:alpha/beta hydrolase family protein [Paraburkholderia denitrificans]|uniref:Alpha/beta hydrolase family protein n=1 Tax=Paraburkholderia denitrificans TaxID=694025 RepID=A0ABW0J5P5_9BURK
MKRVGSALGALLIAVHAGAAPLDHGDLVTLPTRPGVTQSIFITAPEQATPKAVVLLYAGGEGVLRLSDHGPTNMRGNFVIRTASYWVDHGYAVVQVDAPSDHQDDLGMNDYVRRSADTLIDQKAVSVEVRKRFPGAKVVLYSTSRGTVTVGTMLMHASDLADVYVLTSPKSVANREPGISDLDVPRAYRDKTMIMSNERDGCKVAPYYGARRLAEANHVVLVTESSDAASGNACGARSPHGYLGIEQKALDDSSAWLETRLN